MQPDQSTGHHRGINGAVLGVEGGGAQPSAAGVLVHQVPLAAAHMSWTLMSTGAPAMLHQPKHMNVSDPCRPVVPRQSGHSRDNLFDVVHLTVAQKLKRRPYLWFCHRYYLPTATSADSRMTQR